MSDRAALVRGWIRKADSDLADARRTVSSPGPFDTACFHAQQAIEKYLKALLLYRARPVPRTHDLEEIQDLCLAAEDVPELTGLDLTGLSGYAIETRYDVEFWPTRGTASEAAALAGKVRGILLAVVPPEMRP